jgi:hypothetical protein
LGKKTAKTAQKQGKKEVNSTGCYYTLTYELDLLIMAIIVVLVTNLIYLQGKKKNGRWKFLKIVGS